MGEDNKSDSQSMSQSAGDPLRSLKTMSLSSLFKQSSVYLLGDLVRRMISLLMIPVYTRYLSPADYGTIELVELFVMVAVITVGILATSDAMVRIYNDRQDAAERKAVVSTSFWYLGVVSFTLVCFAWMFAEPLSRMGLRTEANAYLVRYAFLAMAFGNLMEMGLVYERMRQRAVFFVAFSVVHMIITLIMNVVLIVFAGWGIWGFIISKVITNLGGALFLVVRTTREVGWRLDRSAARSMFGFGYPLIGSSLALFGIHFADRFFLSRYATLEEVGLYGLAYRFGFLVTNLVGEPFGRAWGVSLYSYAARPDWPEYFSRLFSYLVAGLCVVAVALSMFVDEVLTIVSAPAFHACAQLVPVIALAYVFREMGDFFRGMFFIDKRARLYSTATISCSMLNLALNFPLIQNYGAKGAAWATLCTWLAYLMVCWAIVNKKNAFSYRIRSLGTILILAGFTCWIGYSFVPRLPFWGQWAADMLLLAMFVALVWASGYFPAAERARIVRFISDRRWFFGIARPDFP